MKCSLCSNVALRMVGTAGFCKSHRPEADAAAVRDQKKSQSHRGMMDILRWDTGRFIEKPETHIAAVDHDVH